MTILGAIPRDPAIYGSGLGSVKIERYVDRLISHHKLFESTDAVDLKAFLAKIGGQLEFGETVESLVVRDKNNFTIFLPNLTSWRRDRFTIAHELGHYFLHYRYFDLDEREIPEKRFKRYGRSGAETEANHFAGMFLMPRNRFVRRFGETDGNVADLANMFEVSTAAAQVRCQALRLE